MKLYSCEEAWVDHGGGGMLHMCVALCVCLPLVPLPITMRLLESHFIHISAYEIMKVWCAKHVHASHAMFTALCEFLLGGCVVGTSY